MIAVVGRSGGGGTSVEYLYLLRFSSLECRCLAAELVDVMIVIVHPKPRGGCQA